MKTAAGTAKPSPAQTSARNGRWPAGSDCLRQTAHKTTDAARPQTIAWLRPVSGRVAIAHDSRHNSRTFAKTAASVLAGNGIDVSLFRQLRPTPLLSFAVRHLGCISGIVITSSHNPKEYNGYKAYWKDGAQVTPPHDEGIIAEVARIDSADKIRRMDFETAVDRGRVEQAGAEVDRAYLKAIRSESLHPKIPGEMAGKFRIVYTPLHGAGGTMVPKALRDWGWTDVTVVPSQAKPDGNFPTCETPNPEEPEALAEAIALARQSDADLVLANDPDGDRTGIAVRAAKGRYRLITGNQLGAMLTEYICRERRAQDLMPERPLVVSTIVTSDLAEKIGAHYGVAVEETLTGFKWICSKVRENEERARRGEAAKQFLLGFEESYGFAVGTTARDKDGIVTSCIVAEMAAFERSRGRSLFDLLDSIEMRHGAHIEQQVAQFYEGLDGARKMERIMAGLRERPPREIGGLRVEAVGDVLEGGWTPLTNVSPWRGAIDLPRSNVLMFCLEGGSKVHARPSGTEPKIKFYFNLCDTTGAPYAKKSDLQTARRRLKETLKRVKDDFLRLT